MKKNLILLTVILLSGLAANAVNWQPVCTNNPGVDLYIDTDSFRKISDNECLYAIKYSIDNTPEQVAYIKSDSKTGYLGIINSGDYNIDKYKPNAVFSEPHVFMKPIKENSFLRYSNDYALAIASGKTIIGTNNAVYSYDGKSISEIPVAHKTLNVTPEQLEGYLVQACELLQANWYPPESGNGSRAIIRVTIGNDGSLLKYDFEETSGDPLTDRSIIAAAERTVPYPKFPEIAKEAYSLDFRFVFEHDVVRKSVVY